MKPILLSPFVLALATSEVVTEKDLKLNVGRWNYISYEDKGTQYSENIQTNLGEQRVLKVLSFEDPRRKTKNT